MMLVSLNSVLVNLNCIELRVVGFLFIEWVIWYIVKFNFIGSIDLWDLFMYMN